MPTVMKQQAVKQSAEKAAKKRPVKDSKPSPAKRTKQRPVATRKRAKKRPGKKRQRLETTGEGFLGRNPFAFILYGPSGVGKSSLAAHFPKVGFVIDPQEQGIKDLVEFNQAPPPAMLAEVDTFPGLLKTCQRIANGDYPIQTAVFESLTGLEKLCFHYHCAEHFDGDWSSKGFYSYQQGPKNAAKTDWPRFLDALEEIRDSGINVLLTAHSTIKSYSNPDGADYDRFIPYLDKETWAVTHRWAQAVLFYNYHVELDKRGPRNKIKQGTEQRFIYTEYSAAFDAKNRHGMEPLIDAGHSGQEAFLAFQEVYREAGQ